MKGKIEKSGSESGQGSELYTGCLKNACHCALMDDSSYRLNFDLGKKKKIHHHS
jgi:hypothetical protein